MINRRNVLVAIPAAALMAHQAPRAIAQGLAPGSIGTREMGVMLMNRIGPSASELYIANADGSEERKLLARSAFDYHASYSADASWIAFTSERDGPGQADIYRARPDGTAVERLTDSEAVDDQAALSPDGTLVAFVSTRETYKANIWILDLDTRRLRDLTGQPGIQGDPDKPERLLPAVVVSARQMARVFLRSQFRVEGSQRCLGAHPGTIGLRDRSRRHRPAPRLERPARYLCRIPEMVA